MAPLAIPLVLVLALGGCGSSAGSGSTGASTSARGSAGVSASKSATSAADARAHTGSTHAKTATTHAGGETVATVSGTAITKAAFEHWLAVTTVLSGTSGHGASANKEAKDKALGFLITQQWVFGEAAAKGIAVSEASVHKQLSEVEAKQFKKSGELQRYLTNAHETTNDLLSRVKLELLQQAISARATQGKRTAAEKQAALAHLQDEFEQRWKAKTTCQPGYAMEDCKQS
jgi:hypothetical protein